MKKVFVIVFVILLYGAIPTVYAQQFYKTAEYKFIYEQTGADRIAGITKDKNGFYWFNTINHLTRWDGNSFMDVDNIDFKQKNISGAKNLEFYSLADQRYIYAFDANSRGYKTILTNNLIDSFFTSKSLNLFYTINSYMDRKVIKLPQNSRCINGNYTKNGCHILTNLNKLFFFNFKKQLIEVILPPKINIDNVLFIGTYSVFFSNITGDYIVIEDDQIKNKGRSDFFVKNYVPFYNQILSNTCEKTYLLLNQKFIETYIDKNFNFQFKLIGSCNTKIEKFYYDEKNKILITTDKDNKIVKHILNNNFIVDTNYSSPVSTYSLYYKNNKCHSNAQVANKYFKKDYRLSSAQLSSLAVMNDKNHLFNFFNSLYKVTDKNVEYLCSFSGDFQEHIRHTISTDSVIYFCHGTLDQYNFRTNKVSSTSFNGSLSNNNLYNTICNSLTPNCIYAVKGTEFLLLNMRDNTSKVLATGITGSPRDINVDTSTNTIFISTKFNGCYYYRNNTLNKLPFTYKGNQLNSHYVLMDKDGDYWLPTNEGLYSMLKKDFIAFLNHTIKNIPFRKFGKTEGLYEEEFNGGFQNGGIVVGDSIYMASMAGIVAFSSKLKKTTSITEGRLIIDYIKIDTTLIQNNYNDLTLPANFKQFIIKAAFPFIQQSGNLEYRLIGNADTNWYKVANDGLIQIKYLNAGNYTIEIKTTNNDITTIPIHFTIKPYWYNTWWARLLGFISILSVAFLLFLWRLQNQKNKYLTQEAKSRNKLFAIIAHDLSSPIKNFITIADSVRYLLQAREFDTIAELGNELDQKSRNLDLLLNNIFAWSSLQDDVLIPKKEFFYINEIVENLIPSYKDIAASKKIAIDIQNSSHHSIISDKNIFSIILRNIIDNAIKNTPQNNTINIIIYQSYSNTSVTVTNPIKHHKKELFKEIKNVFVGNKKPQPYKNEMGLGMSLIYEFANQINATVYIDYSTTFFKIKVTINA